MVIECCRECEYAELGEGDDPCRNCSRIHENGERNFFIEKRPHREEKVEHPSHYNRDGAMECIDEMVLVFGREATMHFCLLNAWKYRYRAADKNGEEDLKKSDWYIKKFKELCDETSWRYHKNQRSRD